jgi:hypothetical protein
VDSDRDALLRMMAQARRDLLAQYRPPPASTQEDAFALPDSVPRTDPGPVDVPLLMRVLKRIEADGQRRGWDRNPATPFIVYDHTNASTQRILHSVVGGTPRIWPSARVGTYTGQYLIPAGMLDAPDDAGPWESLRRFAMNLAYTARDDGTGCYRQVNVMRSVLRLPGIAGVGLMSEAWMRELTAEQAEAECGRFVRYADQPDSVEVRNIYFADLHDRIHLVRRSRGDKPFTVETGDGGLRTMIRPNAEQAGQTAEPDAPVTGDITTSLRIICDTITGRTPEPTPEAFAARYPTLEQVITRQRDQDG